MRLSAKRRVIGVLLLGVGAAALAIGIHWRRRVASGPRLVLVYATCTVNRAFLGPYNPTVSYTPALDRFAQQGVVFNKHQTEEGNSSLAFASLLSGTQAMRHGIYVPTTLLDDSVYLMTEAFHDAGYDPFFWANHPMASPELNYAQGVPPEHVFWSKVPSVPPDHEYFLRADDPRFTDILARLRRDPSYRAFVFTNFTITHVPYWSTNVPEFCAAYPDECRGFTVEELDRYAHLTWNHFMDWQFAFDAAAARQNWSAAEREHFIHAMTVLYKSNIFHLDRRFGAVVDAIDQQGLRDQSLVVFTADHGEVVERAPLSLRWFHGLTLAFEDLVVPLIVRGPGIAPGRIDAVTRSIDVFPTLAGLAGIALPPNTTTGFDLAQVLRGKMPPPPLLAFSHSTLLPDGFHYEEYPAIMTPFPRPDPSVMWVAVRAGDRAYKLTSPDGVSFAPHVYDWHADPTETTDLYDPADATQAAMLQQLADYKHELVEGYSHWRAVTAGRVPSQRQQEILRSLGYLK